MKRVWSILKISLLVILSVLFLATLISSLTIGVFDRKLLQQDFYKHQLNEANFYERVYTDVLPDLKAIPDYYGGLSVTPQEQDQLIREIMPPAWLQEQVEAKLDSAIPYLRSDSPELDLTINLVPIKQNASTAVLRFVKNKLGSLPDTPAGQQVDWNQVAAEAAAGKFPSSLPGGAQRQVIEQQVEAAITPYMNQNIDKAPNEVDLVAEVAERNDQTRDQFLSDLSSTRDGIDTMIKTGLPVSYLIMAVLLAAIAAVNWGKLRALLRWVGGTMLFTALPLLVMGLYFLTAGPGLVRHRLENADVQAGIIRLASDLSTTAIKEVSWAFVIPLIVITALGLIVFVLSFLVGKSEKKAA